MSLLHRAVLADRFGEQNAELQECVAHHRTHNENRQSETAKNGGTYDPRSLCCFFHTAPIDAGKSMLVTGFKVIRQR